ncbi:hypothetical protein [Vibrio vulnificus]|uniref:hypothetical protein n=1 Tax=Vibrio vulnificus TaxID=672 RepID=UPI0018E132DB|nr:hypothetical protein [Vibrio vulnificus]
MSVTSWCIPYHRWSPSRFDRFNVGGGTLMVSGSSLSAALMMSSPAIGVVMKMLALQYQPRYHGSLAVLGCRFVTPSA